MLFSSILSHRSGEPHAVSGQIIEYMMDMILREDLINQSVVRFKKAQRLKDADRERVLISIYFELESFILSNKFPTIKENLTKDKLYDLIFKKFDKEKISSAFGFVFLPHNKQVLEIFAYSVNGLVRSIGQNLGKTECLRLLSAAPEETLLGYIPLEKEMLDFQPIYDRLAQLPIEQLTRIFKPIYAYLYGKILDSFGEKSSKSTVIHTFEYLKNTYGIRLAAYFLDISPDGIFDEERYSFMSHEKLTLAENLAKQLGEKIKESERQRDMITKLLAESQALEKRLKSESNQLNSIVSSMGEGLLVVDLAHKISLINPAAERLLGVSAKDATGKRWSDIVTSYNEHGNKIALNERSFAKSVHENRAIVTGVDTNHYYKSISGKIFPVASTTAPLVVDGIAVGAVKVFQDITQEKESKTIIRREVETRTKELTEEKARIAASINSVELGFIITDTKGKIILNNHVLGEILGADQEKWTIEELCMRLKDTIDIIEIFDKCIIDKKPIVISDLNYRSKILRMYFAPIYTHDKNRDLIGAVITMEDITEERIIERSKDEFFSIASHELRTPLTVIRGNAALIKQYYEGVLTDKVLREMINDIHDSSMRLINIVNDFLNMSRLEQRRMVYHKEAFDIKDLINKTISEYRSSNAQAEVELIFEAPQENIPLVFADVDKIKEVVVNLVGNGLKHTDRGFVKVRLKVLDYEVKVFVEDTGRGIPLQNQALLFRKFQQAGESIFTRDTTKGTGLGLYISRLLIEGIGGKIKLEHSEVGRGSVFSFTIPVARK